MVQTYALRPKYADRRPGSCVLSPGTDYYKVGDHFPPGSASLVPEYKVPASGFRPRNAQSHLMHLPCPPTHSTNPPFLTIIGPIKSPRLLLHDPPMLRSPQSRSPGVVAADMGIPSTPAVSRRVDPEA
ncbi:hypothetical protein B0A52_08230 [Exophiala mesophila]|uniref:Uncharacterized protein n=1 Tax=Exophiala mesophila TaxID=212818 RepID=A0A438MWH3_EXOME|nr:hypothetical protein B0A52_08230 [Exophiala mesophila]